jgi:hypothetical protein
VRQAAVGSARAAGLDRRRDGGIADDADGFGVNGRGHWGPEREGWRTTEQAEEPRQFCSAPPFGIHHLLALSRPPTGLRDLDDGAAPSSSLAHGAGGQCRFRTGGRTSFQAGSTLGFNLYPISNEMRASRGLDADLADEVRRPTAWWGVHAASSSRATHGLAGLCDQAAELQPTTGASGA